FYPFVEDDGVEMYGVEAGGDGVETGRHAAPLASGAPRGVLHGNRTYLMSDEGGQVSDTHSISAGLDYPGVGPEHALWKDVGRVNYVAANDDAVLEAFRELTHVEGIMPALESAHALAHAKVLAPTLSPDQNIVVNLSGRGDKDILTVAKIDGIDL
ncbi:MAG: tryptophan synthase subunit beta, partial [Halomonas sp.]|nr:tryptophan synthase subunit beta [Halomonas sp.]